MKISVSGHEVDPAPAAKVLLAANLRVLYWQK
jgi:hypothetical protein